MTAALVFLGGVAGAIARYLIDRAVAGRGGAVPWGTVVANVGGCLAFGVLLGAGFTSGPTAAALGVGLCGALTTYSTFSYDTLRLIEARAWTAAQAYLVLSVIAGVGALVAGYEAARALLG